MKWISCQSSRESLSTFEFCICVHLTQTLTLKVPSTNFLTGLHSFLLCVSECVRVCVCGFGSSTPPPPPPHFSSSLFSLLCICECWTIGCTGGRSTSPLPSVRFHYKQCWRWVERVCACMHAVALVGESFWHLWAYLNGRMRHESLPSSSTEQQDFAKRQDQEETLSLRSCWKNAS